MKIFDKIFVNTIILFCFVFFAGEIKAQITFENVTNTGNFATGGVRNMPISVSHTISGITRVLYVGVSNYRIPATPGTSCAVPLPVTGSVTSVTFNGNTFERLTTQSTNLRAVVSANFCDSVEIFRLTNPPATTADVIVNQPTGGDYTVVGAISFFGVDQMTSPTGAIFPATGSNANPSVTVTTGVNDLVLDVLAADFNAGLANPLQTSRWNGRAFFSFTQDIGAGSTKSANGTSTTTNWTLNNAANWALGGISLKPLGTSASPVSIEGRINQSNGNPIPSSLVILKCLSTGEQFYTQSDGKGRFIFEDVEVGSSYNVQIFNFRYSFTPNTQTFSLTNSVENLNFVGNLIKKGIFLSDFLKR